MKYFAIVKDNSGAELALQAAKHFSVTSPIIVTGNISSGAEYLRQKDISPENIFIDIGSGYSSVLEEIDELAQYCTTSTKVVVIGNVNDLTLYRQLLQRGIMEYFIKPVDIQDIRNAFSGTLSNSAAKSASTQGKVITFMAAASGDGATTLAINTAYILAKDFGHPTLIIDMDYQYGMVARNLDLVFNNSIKEVLEQPEGNIDISVIEKTLVKYTDNLHILPAPKQLRFMPKITPAILANLLPILRTRFKYIIVDLPHHWCDWVASVIGDADKNMLVSQLWLKSVTHATRFLDVSQSVGVTAHKTAVVINRSGSKFKEAITPAEFTTACKKKIDFYIANESKTIINAENQGKTAVEMSNSVLTRQFKEVAESIL